MALIVNKSPAKLSAAVDGVMYDFVPGSLTSVDEAAWKKLKKVKLISRSLDNGALVMGRAAQQVASEAKENIKKQEAADAKKKAEQNGEAIVEGAVGVATASNTSGDETNSDDDDLLD